MQYEFSVIIQRYKSWLILALAAASGGICFGQVAPGNQPLQVTLSVDQPVITEPFPVRVVLHFHNSGAQALWLYRPPNDRASISDSTGGSAVAVELEPERSPTSTASETPAVGTLLRFQGFPHPELFALRPGGDAEEQAAIHIEPAARRDNETNAPVWGAYRMSAVYRAEYPNAQLISSATGVGVWSGSVVTNAIEIKLQSPAAANLGAISGSVSDRDGRLDPGVLVSLADDDQRAVAQTLTDAAGGFRFGELPFGRYWITARWPGADHDTSFFEHADLSASGPEARLKLIMLSEETYEGKQMLHKPVVIRVTDAGGRGVANAALKILWSNGSVTENERAEADETGVAVVNLIPGTNYVTVSKHGCTKLDQMVNVAPGGAIDAAGITYDCKK